MAGQGERALGRHEARVYLKATMRRGRFYLVEVEHIAHATQVVAAPARVGAARSKAEGGRVEVDEAEYLLAQNRPLPILLRASGRLSARPAVAGDDRQPCWPLECLADPRSFGGALDVDPYAAGTPATAQGR